MTDHSGIPIPPNLISTSDLTLRLKWLSHCLEWLLPKTGEVGWGVVGEVREGDWENKTTFVQD